MSMNKIKLGSQGAIVSRMGLGCMGMSESYGERHDEVSAATILRTLELGINLPDTRDGYGIGDNEELIAKTRRDPRAGAPSKTPQGVARSSRRPASAPIET